MVQLDDALPDPKLLRDVGLLGLRQERWHLHSGMAVVCKTLNLDFSTVLAQCSLFSQPYWPIWMELRL
ncbi:hypothetical protein SORBI_3001G261529 [Sorghum bicolor]|uniref:Uncharacterized protein n=1 Tax=Sorghum bicolor TaxID=4558 RepID=A0A109NDN0_SORBI|nr:hypothetical protein SORBI_3001G261529 [Sorghum bicolor]